MNVTRVISFVVVITTTSALFYLFFFFVFFSVCLLYVRSLYIFRTACYYLLSLFFFCLTHVPFLPSFFLEER